MSGYKFAPEFVQNLASRYERIRSIIKKATRTIATSRHARLKYGFTMTNGNSDSGSWSRTGTDLLEGMLKRRFMKLDNRSPVIALQLARAPMAAGTPIAHAPDR